MNIYNLYKYIHFYFQNNINSVAVIVVKVKKKNFLVVLEFACFIWFFEWSTVSNRFECSTILIRTQ